MRRSMSLLLLVLLISIAVVATTDATDTESPKEKMVLVEGGSFIMGDVLGIGYEDELPTHKVTLNYDFYMGKYEVTFEEFDEFCEATGWFYPYDYGWGRGDLPVIYVSLLDAAAYCNWLSEKEGLPKAYDREGNLLDAGGTVTTDITKVVGFRLPTEAEWEYAASGGNKSQGYRYAGSDNVADVAWFKLNSEGKTHEVGKLMPNELGLYDMSGNVSEWCNDRYAYYPGFEQTNPYNTSGSQRSIRGSSIFYEESYQRLTIRTFFKVNGSNNNLGFRLCIKAP